MLNDLLDGLARLTRTTYNSQIINGIPRPEILRKTLSNFINKNEKTENITLYTLIDRFISGEIKHRGNSKSISTLRVYIGCKHHLVEFEAIKKYKIDFETITLEFYYKFIEYLENRKTKYKAAIDLFRKNNQKLKRIKTPIIDLDINTIGKYISKIKVFMGEAVELGYTNNMSCRSKKFAVPKASTDAIYLNEKELEKLYKCDLSNYKRLERVRDLFIFGCYVGLRFQDYSAIKEENIIEVEGDKFIKVLTKKTKELVIIPCSPVVLDIFKKYGENTNKLPASVSNQNFNEYIKEACKKAGLLDKGHLLDEPEKETWECVSSHTARRSFATNYYLEGFPTIDLMKITGHRTEKAFLTYIRISKLDTAKRLNQHMKKKWEEKRIKANNASLSVA
ncbi:site-specific integrase [Segetibacter koreensis]|uniref:site-specific integrase n=1 Tax=Segetibacter koreensis TaxID=398037 RepID=UPI00146E9F70|nr:site-specific integrase [Segetibacter koreensis]